jgi:hypothetical protein
LDIAGIAETSLLVEDTHLANQSFGVSAWICPGMLPGQLLGGHWRPIRSICGEGGKQKTGAPHPAFPIPSMRIGYFHRFYGKKYAFAG